MKLSRSDNHIIITMMKLLRCVLDSMFHQTNKKLVDSIFLAVLGVVCLQNEGAIITRPDRAQHCHSQVLVNQRKYSISFREKGSNFPLTVCSADKSRMSSFSPNSVSERNDGKHWTRQITRFFKLCFKLCMYSIYICALALKSKNHYLLLLLLLILKTFYKSVENLTIKVNLKSKLFLFKKGKFIFSE